ncbi:MAG: hypothetical protein Kow0068_04170 [Marinilabiliales bacterium]
MKKYYIIFIFLLSCCFYYNAIGQSSFSKFKKGIYKDVNEFKNNKPFYTDSFYIEKSSGFMKLMFGTSGAKIITIDTNGKKKKFKNPWGYCLNNQVYIYFNHDFHQLHNYGYYCIFDTDVKARKPGYYYLSSIYIPKSGYYYQILYVVNLNNGKIIRLNKDNMINIILVDDEILLDKFKNMDNTQDNLIKFVELYNSKHPIN